MGGPRNENGSRGNDRWWRGAGGVAGVGLRILIIAGRSCASVNSGKSPSGPAELFEFHPADHAVVPGAEESTAQEYARAAVGLTGPTLTDRGKPFDAAGLTYRLTHGMPTSARYSNDEAAMMVAWRSGLSPAARDAYAQACLGEIERIAGTGLEHGKRGASRREDQESREGLADAARNMASSPEVLSRARSEWERCAQEQYVRLLPDYARQAARMEANRAENAARAAAYAAGPPDAIGRTFQQMTTPPTPPRYRRSSVGMTAWPCAVAPRRPRPARRLGRSGIFQRSIRPVFSPDKTPDNHPSKPVLIPSPHCRPSIAITFPPDYACASRLPSRLAFVRPRVYAWLANRAANAMNHRPIASFLPFSRPFTTLQLHTARCSSFPSETVRFRNAPRLCARIFVKKIFRPRLCAQTWTHPKANPGGVKIFFEGSTPAAAGAYAQGPRISGSVRAHKRGRGLYRWRGAGMGGASGRTIGKGIWVCGRAAHSGTGPGLAGREPVDAEGR